MKSVDVFEIAIQEFDLQSLSEEDLIKARSILSLKLSEADWILNCKSITNYTIIQRVKKAISYNALTQKKRGLFPRFFLF